MSKNGKKWIALSAVAVMAFSVTAAAGEASTEQESAESRENLVFATSTFGQKFSPFFATTAYDMQVVDLTQQSALAADRGGAIIEDSHWGEGSGESPGRVPYPYKHATNLLAHCERTGLPLSSVMMENECALRPRSQVKEYLALIWSTMDASMERGMHAEGLLPGPLHVVRRASSLRRMLQADQKLSADPMQVIDWVNMYAMAVSEENAASGRVVTAPTNGSCGTLPAVLAYYRKFVGTLTDETIGRFLLTAGAIGSLYRMNASISGAEVGCQGEVGVACSMAAAALTEILGGSAEQVCSAAEIAMEHNLGLTCDPVNGQVQVPCIERNAVAAVKAINASRLAMHRTTTPRVSLDKVIETMYLTGKDMNLKYRETARGGLAAVMFVKKCD